MARRRAARAFTWDVGTAVTGLATKDLVVAALHSAFLVLHTYFVEIVVTVFVCHPPVDVEAGQPRIQDGAGEGLQGLLQTYRGWRWGVDPEV